MSDKKPVPPSVAQFALEQLAEAGEQAAIDLTVQNVEILRAEIERRDARIAELEAQIKASHSGSIHLVFDGPPGPECGRFVEAEDATGRSINAGEWSQRADGYWQLVIKQPSDVLLPEPFAMEPYQTVDKGSTNYKAGFNAAIRQARESLNSPTISDGCDTCHGQGEVWSGETAYQGHFQPPEPIMDVCPECSGESVPTVSAGVTLPDDFVCGSKPLQDLLNATAMLLETPSQDSATYWTAQLANVEAILKPASAGAVDERAAFEVEPEGWWNDDHNIYTWPITIGGWGARVECHGHNPAEAQQLAISIVRAAPAPGKQGGKN